MMALNYQIYAGGLATPGSRSFKERCARMYGDIPELIKKLEEAVEIPYSGQRPLTVARQNVGDVISIWSNPNDEEISLDSIIIKKDSPYTAQITNVTSSVMNLEVDGTSYRILKRE